MSTTRFRRCALVLLAAAALCAPTPATAAESLVCGVAQEGHPTYSVTESVTKTRGRSSIVVSTTPIAGRYELSFSLDSASCPGSTYALTVRSTDGSPLGWATTKAATYVGTDTSEPNPIQQPASTVVSADRATATVTFTGDGLARTFEVVGTTSGYAQECVYALGALTNPDGTSQATPGDPRMPCDGGSGGTSYW